MAASRLQTTLGDRTKALCANIVVFYANLYAASGNLLPTGGLESVWFLSGLALWFLALLSAPWFVPPKDALANALGAMAILVTADLGGVGNLKPHLEVVRWIAVAYCAATMVGSVVALFIHDKNKRSPSDGSFRGPDWGDKPSWELTVGFLAIVPTDRQFSELYIPRKSRFA